MYMAYNTIGAKGNAYDNRAIVTEIVNKRLELARLLGYSTYSDYVLAERMAQNTDAVFSMLGKLTWSYLPAARNEMKEIEEYAQAYSEMKPKEAAGIFEAMTDDLELAAKILGAMQPDDRGKILGVMDPEVAARITKIMEPES